MKRFFNPVSLLQSLIALALVAGCLFAAQWQFSRGANQSATNKIIAANLDLPSLSMNEIKDLDAVSNQWRKVTLQGSFSQDKQELVRNRYYEGKFGFEVLTLFTATNGENFWVDRGWVAAGPNAATPPIVEPVASGNLEITKSNCQNYRMAHIMPMEFSGWLSRYLRLLEDSYCSVKPRDCRW